MVRSFILLLALLSSCVGGDCPEGFGRQNNFCLENAGLPVPPAPPNPDDPDAPAPPACNPPCGAELPFCDEPRATCVECLATEHCAEDERCDTFRGVCFRAPALSPSLQACPAPDEDGACPFGSYLIDEYDGVTPETPLCLTIAEADGTCIDGGVFSRPVAGVAQVRPDSEISAIVCAPLFGTCEALTAFGEECNPDASSPCGPFDQMRCERFATDALFCAYPCSQDTECIAPFVCLASTLPESGGQTLCADPDW